MFWKIVLVLGLLGTLLGFLVAAISAALPFVNGPATSWDEAMIGIIPGIIVMVFSFFIFLIGLVFVIMKRKKTPAV